MNRIRNTAVIALCAAVLVLLIGAVSVYAANANYILLDENMQNGSVRVDNIDIETQTPEDGREIRLIPVPEEGYALKEWHVYYRNDNREIPVEKYNNELDQYFFVIPKTNRTAKYIIISAEFEPVDTVARRVDVYCPDNSERGSKITIDREDGMYLPGETVTVTIFRADGSDYAEDGIFASHYYDIENDVTVGFKDFLDLTQIDEYTYSFTMPKYEVSLICVFVEAQAEVTVEKYFVEEGRTGAEMTEEELAKYKDIYVPVTKKYNWEKNDWEIDEEYPKRLYTGDKLCFYTANTPRDDEVYFVTDIDIVYFADGQKVVENIVERDNIGPNRELTAYMIMPGVDTTVLFTVDRIRHVDSPNTEYGRVVPSLSRAVPGDTVKLTPAPEKTWECASMTVKDADGSEIPLDENNCFVMPDGDVTVSGEWQKEYVSRQLKHKDVDNVVWDLYYSDEYFLHPSTEYDPHLSSLSAWMTAFSMNQGGPDNINDTHYYEHQSDRVHAFFDTIGFTNFEANEDYHKRTGFDTIGIAMASRQIGDTTVIAVVPRSGGYYLEWGNNVWLGDGTKSNYMHEGWYNAAVKLLDFLKRYTETYDITGHVKLWMAGYSRGGAVTNIAAGLLDNSFENGVIPIGNGAVVSHEDLFAYTFEAPQGANVYSTGISAPKSSIYDNIWNIVNPNDLVPKVAMAQYGFTRFGQDRFVTTEFFDPANIDQDRLSYTELYMSSHHNNSPDAADLLKTCGISGEQYAIMMTGVGSVLIEVVASAVEGELPFVSSDVTKEKYDANIVTTLILEEMTRVIGSRKNYVDNYQEGMRNLCMAVMSDVSPEGEDKMAKVIDAFILAGAGQATGCIVPLGGTLDKLLDKTMYDAGLVEKKLLDAVEDIFKERPTELITLALNVKSIFANHDTGIAVGHVLAQDDYYIDAYNDGSHSDKIHVVPLRDNADMGRIVFESYNDLQVNRGGTTVVNVHGDRMGKSGVSTCEFGYAVGYYSYFATEKMELFFPVNTDFTMDFKSYSKQFSHEVSYKLYCQYNSLGYSDDDQLAHLLDKYSEDCSFDSDTKTIRVNVRP